MKGFEDLLEHGGKLVKKGEHLPGLVRSSLREGGLRMEALRSKGDLTSFLGSVSRGLMYGILSDSRTRFLEMLVGVRSQGRGKEATPDSVISLDFLLFTTVCRLLLTTLIVLK